ncbi:MAG: hypothetical protein EOO48_00190 [Flavobacterium sp.]|nr:MAG: hypothetical protein EOO48_00190 [Flavobacterium sp.]
MEDRNYLSDIHEIKDLMNRSTQFISLSGLSGVLAGIYALIGAFFAHSALGSREFTSDNSRVFENDTFLRIVFIAAIVLLLSIGTAFVLTYRKAEKQGEKIWNGTSRRMIVNFLIPLCTGGIFSIILLRNQYYNLIGPVMLIFYGLACVNASKYTLRDVRYLGITMVLLGLIASEFWIYGLEFWALGFGVCHIIYGSIMHFKYDRN